MKFFLLALLCVMALPLAGQTQTQDDKAAVKQAALDYIEAIYNVDPSKVERSVHPELAKRGFYMRRGATEYSEGRMTFAQLIETAKNWNKEGKLRKDAPKEVIILDLLDQTASVKIVAEWGIDYMHLAKYNGKWMIVNILWQSHPKKSS